MTSSLRKLAIALGLLALAFSSAWAAKAPADEAPKEQSFDFEADTLSAEYLKPNVDMLEGLRRGRRSSLISVRLNFVAEIVKSADDI